MIAKANARMELRDVEDPEFAGANKEQETTYTS